MHHAQRQLKQIAIGLGMMIVSVILLSVVPAALFAALVLPALGVRGMAGFSGIEWVILLAVPIYITSTILSLIGPCMCLGAPRESRAAAYVLSSILLSGLALALHLAALLIPALKVVAFIPLLLQVVVPHLFILFCQQMGMYLQRPEIVAQAKAALRLGIIAAGLLLVAVILSFVVSNDIREIVSAIAGLCIFILLILELLRYMTLLWITRSAILQAANSP